MSTEWDTPRVIAREMNRGVAPDSDELGYVSTKQATQEFVQFLRTYREEAVFPFRDQLQRHFRRGQRFLTVDLQTLASFKQELHDLLLKQPNEYLPPFEDAIKQVLVMDGVEDPPAFQVVLSGNQNCIGIRDLTAAEMNRLVRVTGIVISAARAKPMATTACAKCKTCNNVITLKIPNGFSSVPLPRYCSATRPDTGDANPEAPAEDCGVDPYQLVADRCTYVDQQVLKLQEPPDMVPTGEMPRHVLLSVDRSLVDAVTPGTRVSVLGVSSVFTSKAARGRGPRSSSVRTPYLRVVGIRAEEEGSGRAISTFSPDEEEEFKAMAARPDMIKRFCESIAPSISGADTIADIKRAVMCLLFGGSRKLLPDGMRLRGDINVLLLGDPSTAKSQFLKFVEKVAPVGVYTSGKGSSAAGLTATVLRDAKGEFFLEGGAMVLADGGVVCIDEFDKMREEDRVAIHEAMEQQTISVAKAGITTILNSRAAVLAAANPVFGRYDDTLSAAENIDFLPTILSRFDLIFIVRDIRNTERDLKIARHVINVHMNSTETVPDEEGEIGMQQMKKYIAYCRSRCAPRLSEAAAGMLETSYVRIRDTQRKRASTESVIPITVRQLEALVRVSESFAKATLQPQATEEHVEQALDLFNVSTLNAAASGLGVAAMSTEMQAEVKKCEEAVKKMLNIGSVRPASDVRGVLLRQGHSSVAVDHAFRVMAARGELQPVNERRLMKRLK